MDFLEGKAKEVATRAVAEEESKRRHLVVSLSGAHAYGFPSPDSDLDLKAIHITTTRELLGLEKRPDAYGRLEVIDGVEIDYTSNELRPVLAGILGGNGNYIERVLGTLIAQTSTEHEELRPLVQKALSKKVYHHYRGFAANQRKAFDEAEHPTAKKLLYVLRTALTGTHLLRSGELRVDLTTTANEYGFGEATSLIETKRAGEQVTLETRERDRWASALDKLFENLEQALEASCLPVDAPNSGEIEAWLIEVRRRSL